MAQGRVTKIARDNDGNVVDRAHDNPILETRKCIVEFEGGEEAELTVNVIAESMYAQCGPDVNQYVIFDSIVDYRRSTTTLCKADKTTVRPNDRNYMRRSTKGWQLFVQWKDCSTSREKLADMKGSHPIECAEYAVSQDIADEPPFTSEVPFWSTFFWTHKNCLRYSILAF